MLLDFRESNVNVPGLWVYRIGNVRRLEEPDMSRVETEATTQGLVSTDVKKCLLTPSILTRLEYLCSEKYLQK